MAGKHSPGPYFALDFGRSPVGIVSSKGDGAEIAKVYVTAYRGRGRSPEHEANLRLFLKAPEMFDALKEVAELTLTNSSFNHVRALIAEIEG